MSKPAHVLRTMVPKEGDEHITWDPADEDSVKKAKKRFDALVNPKHAGENAFRFNAYRVERVPRQGQPITEFDPTAGEILIAPPMVGG